MILLTERIEAQLKGYFQKQIQLIVKDRKLVTGKLILYRIDGFYIVLTIQTANGCDTVEVPYPFNIIEGTSKLQFDYRLDSLAEKDFNLLFVLQSISKRRESKFYNALLEISQP